MLKIIHSNDMPAPTPEAPFAQVEWLFEQRAALAKSRSSRDKLHMGKRYFVNFLRSGVPDGASPSPYWVDHKFDEYTLLRFKAYVDDLNISSGHTVGLLSAVRQAFEMAIANRWIELKSFIDFTLPAPTRETETRRPYTEAETIAILAGLKKEILVARRLLKPYVRTARGRAPTLIPSGKGRTRYENGWWTEEDNLRWYFENVLDCRPVTGADPDARQAHRVFLTNASNHHGGLHALYHRWGVSAWVGPEAILPYVYKLVAETGLNPTVALALRLDDYQESHPLTKRPYIRYFKERGSGEGELHLELIDSGILVLDDQQARDVARIWEEVTALTASFREELPLASRDRLFVYQSRASHSSGSARDFLMDAKTTGHWAKAFVARHQLKDVQGAPLNLTLVRFRPSLVSRMLKRDVDIYVIQSILGHRSILTTLRYIDSHDFHPKARKEVQKALEAIRENRRQQEESPKPVATETFEENQVIFATGLALCKNVFAPPEHIRRAGRIAIGSPCTFFNMCLRCPNVLITQEHLPQLFALRRQYLVAMVQGLSATTHRAAIQQSLHILNNLLDHETSDWPDDLLAEAERQSELIDSFVDPAAIRVVAT